MAPAMPCKRMVHPSITKVMQSNGNEKEYKTMYGRTVESHESTRQQLESSQPKDHEKDLLRCFITNWCTSFFRCHKRWRSRVQKRPWTRNGKSSRQSQHEIWESQEQKVGYLGSTNRQQKSPLCVIDGHMSCKRRFWSLRSFYWTGIVCVPDDCRKNHGCYCKITRLSWTSSWCSICLHSGVIGGCSQIARNSWVRMSRRVDTSSKTWMADIMGKHWRSRGSSLTECIRSPTCWLRVAKTTCGGSIETWIGKKYWIGNVCLFIEHEGCLCQYLWMTWNWLERSRIWLPCGRNGWKAWIWTNPHHFLTMYAWDFLSVNANRMTQSSNNARDFFFESRISAGATEKLPGWQKPHAQYGSVVLRHGGTCSKMRWTILWISEQGSGAASQSFASLFGWSSIQTGGTGISWRIVRSLLANCLEMLVLGTNWTTRYSMVSEQILTINY